MKTHRQELILKLIKENRIETQEDLALRIKNAGIKTTQATISRDLRELEIEKVLDKNGGTRYAVVTKPGVGTTAKYEKLLADTVRSVDYAVNLVVLKCYVGMGNAAGAAVDAMDWEDIVGTIAGDDTLLIITKSEVKAIEVCKRLQELSR